MDDNVISQVLGVALLVMLVLLVVFVIVYILLKLKTSDRSSKKNNQTINLNNGQTGNDKKANIDRPSGRIKAESRCVALKGFEGKYLGKEISIPAEECYAVSIVKSYKKLGNL